MPRIRRKVLRHEAKNTFLLLLGMFAAGMGIDGFLVPSGFIDGGVTGVSMLLSRVTDLPLALLLPIVNVPFVLVGLRHMGRAFALRSIAGIAGLSLVIAIVPFPSVTSDPLLTAVFGGLFLGAGIGLAVRGGAVLDGTEIAALIVSKRSPIVGVGDIILAFNAVLFLVALGVLGIERSLYSILTYVAAAKTLDFVLHGIDEYTAITIVSDRNVAIRLRITDEMGRGVTVYRGYGGKTGAGKDILYCVVTRLEISRVRAIVREEDAAAFVVFHSLTGVEGGVMRHRHVH